jgi:hypothetical protein
MGNCTSPNTKKTFIINENITRPIDIELYNFDTFFDNQQRGSLLSNHLSDQIFNEYLHKSCSQGVSFTSCILAGVKNRDAEIGVYAGS